MTGLGSRETALVVAAQRRLPGPRVVAAARGLSLFGDHAAGWLAAGVVGALACPPRHRSVWAAATGAVLATHGVSVVLKRVVRRHRPLDPAVRVLVATPSRWSFPSSHATSTTTAAILYGGLVRCPLSPLVVPPMLASRLLLGVHYPSDVLAGWALGALVGAGVWRRLYRELLP